MPIQWEKPKSTYGRGKASSYAKVGINKSGSQRSSLVVTLSAQAMQSMRWIAGDRAAIGFDGNTIYVKRVNDGYAMSATNGSKEKNRKKQGTSCRVTISMTKPDWADCLALPVELTPDDVTEVDGMLAISMERK